MTRYNRQILLPSVGEEGQQKLSAARVLLVGCGALGTVAAEQLVRAGVGELVICDRDVVELSNLQRQTLFNESDARGNVPKAFAAARRLREINSSVCITPHVIDINTENIEQLISASNGISLVLDGTDNAETRYLINDAAIKQRISWVYAGCVGTSGRVMGVVPGGACLRCMFAQPPAAGEVATCDTAGVLASAAGVAASIEVAEAIKILIGDPQAGKTLISFDLWPMRFSTVSTANARRNDCVACALREFEFLNRSASATSTLCGRNTVQVRAGAGAAIDLEKIARQLEDAGAVDRSSMLVRCALRDSSIVLTVFPDGRALIHGTSDASVARSVYSRFVGW